ncbi:MAG TPA: ATP-binding cassette domain-containing protein [Candidatus Nitrosocosmicus sp.]|nr:ATP-binding cassette domain-containing protein [Candidatus Nitrosocosmicus sp.]
MIQDETRVLVRTEKLGKSYKLANELKDAVRDADLRIVRGEFVVIQGLYGLKKNAFFNLIGCLEKPTAGKYYFDYEDIALAKPHVLDDIRRLKLGYLFRNFNLIGRLSAARNIEVPLQGLNITVEEKHQRVADALKSFGIEDISEKKACDLDCFEKQLVALARAVVNKPLMIIADEPAAELDSREEQKLMEHLLRLNSEGTAIMLITEKTDLGILNSYRRILFENGMVWSDKGAHKLSLVRREA